MKIKADQIKAGMVGVIPTDTIYGISASVNVPGSVERIYRLTGRPADKPFIILAAGVSQIEALGVRMNESHKKGLDAVWPGPNSVIIEADAPELEYLHRGKKSLAFRVPETDWLVQLLTETGPIVSTSANRSGQPTPDNIEDIKKELPGLDFYIEGEVAASASKLFKIDENGELTEIPRG